MIWATDNQYRLFQVVHHSRNWVSPKALLIFHGIGEHGGRYLHFPNFLRNDVDAVVVHDHRGHGRSDGVRGYIPYFDRYAEDAALVVRRVDALLKERFGSSELHLLGHSMGGLVALRLVLNYPKLPLKSVTLSAPALGVKVEIPAAKQLLAHIMSRVWGSLQLNNEIDLAALSHDPEVAKAIMRDRWMHVKGTPRLYTEMLRAISDTLERTSEIDLPLQMLLPGDDRLVDSEVATRYFERLSTERKRLCRYPGFFHESFNEVGKELAFADLRKWLIDAQ